MNARLLLKGDFIAAVEFGDKCPTMTIKEAKLVDLEQEDGSQKQKGVVFFQETPRGWVLNRTNLTCLIALLGNETDEWTGKRITLHAVPVKFGGKTEPGIRIKGMPDLPSPLDVEVKLPRRKPIKMTMVNTGNK